MSERILSFRPFRRVGDKLVVTSYMGWRKIYTANYEGATVKLLPFPEIQKDEVVYAMGNPDGQYNYWHPTKFEPLFWPVNGKIRFNGYGETIVESLYEQDVVIKTSFGSEIKDDEVYSMFDCSGCPTFSHITEVYVSENYPDKMHLFETLTADIIYKYFEIMRDALTTYATSTVSVSRLELELFDSKSNVLTITLYRSIGGRTWIEPIIAVPESC